jgi:hypothetical protein
MDKLMSYFYMSTLCRILNTNNMLGRNLCHNSGIYYKQDCSCRGISIDESSIREDGDTIYFKGDAVTKLYRYDFRCPKYGRYNDEYRSTDHIKFDVMITVTDNKVDLLVAVDTKRYTKGKDYIGEFPYSPIYGDASNTSGTLSAIIEESYILTPKGLLIHQNHILDNHFTIYVVGKNFKLKDGIDNIDPNAIFEVPEKRNLTMEEVTDYYKKYIKTNKS